MPAQFLYLPHIAISSVEGSGNRTVPYAVGGHRLLDASQIANPHHNPSDAVPSEPMPSVVEVEGDE